MKIVRHVGEGKKVLDVGCGAGYLDAELKKRGCYVVGIEINEDALKTARKHCDHVITQNVEYLEEVPYPDCFFDVIVYGDVLEHLVSPELVMRRLKRYLASNGYIVASIPNVGYWRIRIKLLTGKFEYEGGGIMDRTHLRFFTINSAISLVEKTGHVIQSIDYTGWASRFRFLRTFPGLFAYQFIIVAKKGDDYGSC